MDLAKDPAYFVVEIPIQLYKDIIRIEATQVKAKIEFEAICSKAKAVSSTLPLTQKSCEHGIKYNIGSKNK